MNSRIAVSVLRQLGHHVFSTAAISRSAAAGGTVHSLLAGTGMRTAPATWVASVRFVGTVPATEVGGEAAQKGGAVADGSAGGKKEKAVVSYWGMAPAPKVVKEDGTEWRWSCFKVFIIFLRKKNQFSSSNSFFNH